MIDDGKSDEECAAIWKAFGVSFEHMLYVMNYWQGRREMARRIILLQGRIKFGPPTQYQEAIVTRILNLDRLREIALRLLDVNTWDELLAGA
jgi:hypothetical protein